MNITEYKFGQISIDNKNYTSDIIILRDKIIPDWWREEGHLLKLSDIKDFVSSKPEVLVIGTGFYGVMEINDSLKEYCKNNEIILAEFPSEKAVDYYNNLKSKKNVVFAIHLTC